MSNATSSLTQQEREFQKAVQPGSPISTLLSLARQPLMVAPAGGTTIRAILWRTDSTPQVAGWEEGGCTIAGKGKQAWEQTTRDSGGRWSR